MTLLKSLFLRILGHNQIMYFLLFTVWLLCLGAIWVLYPTRDTSIIVALVICTLFFILAQFLYYKQYVHKRKQVRALKGSSLMTQANVKVEFLQANTNVPLSDEIRAAVVFDEFTFNSFSPEMNAAPITPDNWRSVFEEQQPEIFFCESAWAGNDPSTRPWQGQIYSRNLLKYDNITTLLEILGHCRKHGIPTVFWNKEDPTYFNNKRFNFVETASLFDFIFTTAEECIPLYKQLTNRTIESLPFAAQHRIFNPMPVTNQTESVIYAGSWYEGYEKRNATLTEFFSLITDSKNELIIYNRMGSMESPYTPFPSEYHEFIRPRIPHQETAAVYRKNKFGLTINTVTDSNTMFARRIFELAACGSVVLSNYSPGIEHFFEEDVIFLDREPEKFLQLTEVEHSRMRVAALERVLMNHTYIHRWEKVLKTVGINFASNLKSPVLVFQIGQIEELRTAKAYYLAHSQYFLAFTIVVNDDTNTNLMSEISKEFPDSRVSIVTKAQLLENNFWLKRHFGGQLFALLSPVSPSSVQEVQRMTLHRLYQENPTLLSNTKFIENNSGKIVDNCILNAQQLQDVLLNPNRTHLALKVPA